MDFKTNIKNLVMVLLAVLTLFAGASATSHAQTASAKKPNIIVIMGDDIRWFNLNSYNQGIMLNATRSSVKRTRRVAHPANLQACFVAVTLRELTSMSFKTKSAQPVR
jgi:hypothetical protein